ncbi:hypothetical protein [Tenacibaculum sp. 190524A05c]|uniref:Lipoprotein n=1 Tax=Tenacibaculum platacis TaxID=3137852 RepID=A0ABM9P3R5_9FLAO
MKKRISKLLKLFFLLVFFSCNSPQEKIRKYYSELNIKDVELTNWNYDERVGIPNISQSENELEIRRYEKILISGTTNLILLSQNGNKCNAQVFAESNVPKIKIDNINTSNLNSCELIESLLKNNIHRLTDFSDVLKEITKDKPLPFTIMDGKSYYIQVKIKDKIYEMSYSDFQPHLELFPKNKELNEYNNIYEIYNGITF